MTTALLLGIAATGCATATGGAATYSPGDAVTLASGEQIVLPDSSTLKYVETRNDSRCPPGAQCIRAGDVEVVLDYQDAANATRTVVANMPESMTTAMGDWTLELVKVEFGPTPPVTIRVVAGTR